MNIPMDDTEGQKFLGPHHTKGLPFVTTVHGKLHTCISWYDAIWDALWHQCGVRYSGDFVVQVLKGSRQQTTAGGKQAGIMPEEPDEDEAMPEAEAEDAEAEEAAEREREQAPGSYVASLLQQTSLEDNPGIHTCLSDAQPAYH